MIIRFLLIPLIIMIPIGVYLYHYFLRVGGFWGLNNKLRKTKVLATTLAFIVIILSVNLFGVGALVVLHMVAVAILMELINLVHSRLHNNKKTSVTWWKKAYGSGLVPIIVTALILGFGYFNMNNVVETAYTVHTQKQLRAQGYKIAFISDLHFGTTINDKKLERYCDEISRKKPDLVVLGGDIVDETTSEQEMKSAVSILSKIKSNYGVIYVYGNHDKSNYRQNPNFTANELVQEMSKAQIRIMEDEAFDLNEDISIVGRKDKGFISSYRETTETLLKDVDRKRFILLLDHQPSDIVANSKAGVDLQLSGHTHGGQIWPVGLMTDLLGFGQINYGYKKLDNYQIIVSSGMAGWGYPIRTGSKSEFVIIELKK